MQHTSSRLLTATFAALLCSGFALAQSSSQTGSSQSGQSGSGSSGSQTQPQDPNAQDPNINTAPPQQPAPPPGAAPKKEPGSDAPITSPDTVTPKNSKDDVDAIGNRSVGKGVNFYSIEKEIALGKQLAQEVERSAKMVDDPVVTEYVNRVGQNLVRNSDARVPFTIKVIDSDEVNAFALPGGFFYVNSGLILRAQEESELAGVMAHEIAHVAARHGTKQATKGDLIQIASIPAMIFIPYSWAGYAMYQGLNFLIPMTFLKFSRDAEREADFLGLQYMYKAGYDPNSYVTFFERIQADEKRRPGTIGKAFSTHPPTPERIENTQKEIAKILPARQEYIVTSSEFDSVKSRLRNIMFARKAVDNSPNKPTLRTRTEQTDKQKTQTQTDPSSGDDDRPTLKRRTDDNP
jgi:beta-barrel assembly-enhancing protease